MANAYEKMRFVLDTAHATNRLVGTLVGQGLTYPLKLKTIRWVGADTGQTVVLASTTGVTIWESIAQSDDYVEECLIEIPIFTDMVLPTLAGGRLYLYLAWEGLW